MGYYSIISKAMHIIRWHTVADFLQQTWKRDKVTLSFEMVGSEDVGTHGLKAPIIFLHGMTSAKESWRNVMRPIAAATGRKAYAYDARNHGDSGWSEALDYGVMQDDLLEFMDGIRAERAVLVGHSMGGKTAMFFAAKRPDKVERLIVEDISPKHQPPPIREQARKYVELLESVLEKIPEHVTDLEDAKSFVHEQLQQKIREGERSTRQGSYDGSILPLAQDENGKFKWKANLRIIKEKFLGATRYTELEGKFPGPTLFLYGTRSPYRVSSDMDVIRRAFPATQFRAVEGATHQIHLEYEDVFVKEVTDFINELL